MAKEKTLHTELTAFLMQLKGLNSALLSERRTPNDDGAAGVLNFVNSQIAEMLVRNTPTEPVQ
jgi:hypothetical protein